MAELTELEQTKLKDLFDRLDADGDGLITPDDLKGLFSEAGYELDDEQADVSIYRHLLTWHILALKAPHIPHLAQFDAV